MLNKHMGCRRSKIVCNKTLYLHHTTRTHLQKHFMRLFISLFTLFIFQYSIAQKISLKRPLTKEDLVALDAQVKECLGYEATVNFTFNTRDFYDSKYFTGDPPNSISQVHELEKQLKGNYRDAVVYNNIGMAYKGLFMPVEANKNFEKALELALLYVKNNPDSALVHDLLAGVYVNLVKLPEAITSYQNAYKLDNHDSLARLMIPLCNVFDGNFTAATAAIDKMLGKPADEFDYFSMLTLINYWSKMSAMQQMEPVLVEKELQEKLPEQIFDLSKMKAAYEKHKDKTDFELLYRFNRHLAVCVKTFMRTVRDPAFTIGDIRFKIEQKDIAELNTIESFYKKCLDDKTIPNKYILYKSIGNIELLKGDAKAAIPFLTKSIALKPVEKSKFDDNAAEDYDNLGAAWFILKDTVSYEKIMKEKFLARPAINPLPDDYATMARIAFHHGDRDAVKKYSEEGLKLNPKLADAHICLAALALNKGDIKDAYAKIDSLYAADPQNFAIYILQGICLLHDNDVSSAYTAFNMAKGFVRDPKWIDDEILKRFFLVD